MLLQRSVCYFRGACVTLEEHVLLQRSVCYFRGACVTLEERVTLRVLL